MSAKVVSLHAHDFEGMFRDLEIVAEATGADARPLISKLRARVEVVKSKAEGASRVRVFCMDWLDPIIPAGLWVNEMVAMAGGETADLSAEKLILMPCGFTMERTRRELHAVKGWTRIPAVQSGEVYLADGPSYFNGAGPRLVDGLEILAEILHPERFERIHRRGYARLGAS